MSKRARLTELATKRQSTYVGYIHPDSVDATWANCMMALIEHDRSHSQRLLGRIYVGSGPRVASSRNLMVRQFLAMPKQAEWLFMVDTDMVFAPDVLDQYFEVADPVERPIIGGLCFAGGKGAAITPVLYRISVNDEGYPVSEKITDYPKDALIKVDATGGACLLIHRTVLEGVGARWADKTAYPWFAETEYGKAEFGEDVTFCMRAANAGFPLHVHTGIVVGHRKLHTLDDRTYEDQQNRIEEGTQEQFERRHFEALGLLERAA